MIKKTVLLYAVFLFFAACDKLELSELAPKIQLKIFESYVYSDTSISVGKQYIVGITASSAGGENLTNLIVESNGIRVYDKGYNMPEISVDLLLTKTIDEIENFKFILFNKARKSDTISITISKLDAAYSSIIHYNSIVIGAQTSAEFGNYFSCSNGQLYTQAQASNNQSLIDLIYYYDASGDLNTLASPGANLTEIITGAGAPETWSIKRTTYFSREAYQLIEDEFSTALNDSLILANLFTNGGRKAKLLQNNQYYGFQTVELKYGILKIENVSGQTEGTLQFSLIIQQ